MRKHRLNLDALEVESFGTDGGEQAGKGTVFANSGATDFTACLDCFTNANTCTMVPGCVQTRADTCYPCG
jgi:hypothetical protein